MQLLIDSGADVNKADKWGNTPLIKAAKWSRTDCMELLLKAEADVNFADEFGDTALMAAAKNNALKSLYLLIKAGADVNAVDNFGINVLISVLVSHSIRSIPSIKVKCTKLLLLSGAKINICNTSGNDMLKKCTQDFKKFCDKETITLLFAAGYVIDAQTLLRIKDGDTTSLVDICDQLNQKFCLQHSCRETIRKHLLELDRHGNLFCRIPKLGLPSSLADYLLYYISVAINDDEYDCGNDMNCCFNGPYYSLL